MVAMAPSTVSSGAIESSSMGVEVITSCIVITSSLRARQRLISLVDHFLFQQALDIVCIEAKIGKHTGGMLTEQGRRSTNRIGAFHIRQIDRQPNLLDFTHDGMLGTLDNATRQDLFVVKDIFKIIDGPGRNTMLDHDRRPCHPALSLQAGFKQIFQYMPVLHAIGIGQKPWIRNKFFDLENGAKLAPHGLRSEERRVGKEFEAVWVRVLSS